MQRVVFEGEKAELDLLVKLARRLNVRVETDTQGAALRSLKAGLEELKQVRQGRRTSRPASQLLDELRRGE